MNILFIIQCTNLGGMEQSALLLLLEFQKLGHTCELLSLHEVGELGELIKNRVPVSSVGYRGKWGWRSFFPLRRLLKTKQPDAVIMVGHNLMATLALGDIGKDKRLLALHFHHKNVMSNWAWKINYRVASSRFKYLVYPSNFTMREALDICPFLEPSSRMVSGPIVLPPAATPDERTKLRRELNLSATAKIIGNAGWLIPRKRWDIFLQVAQHILRKIPEARFVIAGDGPELPKLKLLAKELGIEERVSWLGWQKDLVEFYQVLDVLLFNSDWDALGRTPLEAMAHGVPVVASVLNGGLKEVINNDRCGYVIDSHDVPKLAAKVVEILTDDLLAAEMSKQSRARIAEVGSPELHAERMLQLLNE